MPGPRALVTRVLHVVLVFAVCAAPAMAQQRQRPSRPDRQERNRGPRPGPHRVEERSYVFSETGETIPYALFVSSKVSKDVKSPLIVALHGLGSGPATLLRGPSLKLAEEGGYIMVGPMGYSQEGWYGSPIVQLNRRSRGGEPKNLREYSEKDVLNVLDLVRHEFNVDENRIYLMGHSMGGAGAFHLAVKYPGRWAAIAAIAPAAFELKPSSLRAVPDLPVMIVHGDADSSVPVSLSRSWVDYMKSQRMTERYVEIAGAGHGDAIGRGMPDIFAFFGEHAKTARR